MKGIWLGLPWCVALLIGAGCGGAHPGSRPEPAERLPDEPTRAQPKLPMVKLWLGPAELNAEIAASFDQIRTGMMFRQEMPENEGMLFIFARPHQAAFWMKNTQVPLSAAYLDPEGVILEIHELEPHNTNSVTAASDRVQFVLEVNRGWFDRHGVRPGDLVRTPAGGLQQTFLPPR